MHLLLNREERLIVGGVGANDLLDARHDEAQRTAARQDAMAFADECACGIRIGEMLEEMRRIHVLRAPVGKAVQAGRQTHGEHAGADVGIDVHPSGQEAPAASEIQAQRAVALGLAGEAGERVALGELREREAGAQRAQPGHFDDVPVSGLARPPCGDAVALEPLQHALPAVVAASLR